MPEHTSDEIRKWKALIYGPNIGCGNKVDGWANASIGNVTLTPRSKKNRSVGGGTPRNHSSSSSSLNASSQSLNTDNWMGGSPCGTKRSYRTKGAKDAIGKPSLY